MNIKMNKDHKDHKENKEQIGGKLEEHVAHVDRILTVEDLYSQLDTPSLARGIFHQYKQTEPLAGIISLYNNSGTVQVIRENSEVFESQPKNSGITQEAIQDIVSQFGLSGLEMIARLLRSMAAEEENEKTLEFLQNNATTYTALTLGEPSNAIITQREIGKVVSEIVLKINEDAYKTYKSVVVLPQKYAAAFMALNKNAEDNLELLATKIGLTEYFINPDPQETDAYVLLKSDVSSSGFFSEYTDDLTFSQDYETGQMNLFLFNRFAITANPLHSKNSMIYKFGITE